ncbi:MAG: uncharacterized protein JWP41_4422 [Ramlibacter sp.]|nr:uncharacterized protein [Ramlibacter sp.]
MSNAESADDPTQQPIETSFGIFYPVGYIVAGFPEPAQAEQVRRDLLTGGYDAKDCVFHGAAQVADATQRNLEEHTGFLATLGRNDEMVRRHLEAARKGAAFLLIYAPGDLEASRAMNVVRRVPFVFAHRYHRLAIEELT